jgi:hypothetical protein
VVFAIVWLFVALGIGLYARKTGFKFWTYFLISTFFTPLVAAIVFAVESSQIKKPRRKIESKNVQINKPPK